MYEIYDIKLWGPVQSKTPKSGTGYEGPGAQNLCSYINVLHFHKRLLFKLNVLLKTRVWFKYNYT